MSPLGSEVFMSSKCDVTFSNPSNPQSQAASSMFVNVSVFCFFFMFITIIIMKIQLGFLKHVNRNVYINSD